MQAPFPRLRSLATAVPQYTLGQDEIVERAARVFPQLSEGALQHMLSVFGNAGISTRYSCVPGDWYEQPHGWAEKNALFLENAVELTAVAAEKALTEADMDPAAIDFIVSVSTSGIATPSLDARLVDRLGLRRDVQRLPIFGLGCAGGVIGLARANDLVRSRSGGNALCVVVELCALTFRCDDRSKSNIVASALFGDGAAAAVLSGNGRGPSLCHSGEHTWEDSLDIMGWTVEDDGLGVLFSRDIPTLTRTAFREAAITYLNAHALAFEDIDHFVCHPGGAKVLDALEEAFDLKNGQLEASRSVLRDFGNMSATTVLFVLERLLRQGEGGRLLMSALGPGFTAAFLTLETE